MTCSAPQLNTDCLCLLKSQKLSWCIKNNKITQKITHLYSGHVQSRKADAHFV